MKPALIDALRSRHPTLLAATGREASPPGILCGDGWFNLVDCLCEALAARDAAGASLRVDEIKSKYGTLRFEASGLTAEGDALVAMAEALSGRTCETCGAPGTEVDRAGWISTLCSMHAQRT